MEKEVGERFVEIIRLSFHTVNNSYEEVAHAEYVCSYALGKNTGLSIDVVTFWWVQYYVAE